MSFRIHLRLKLLASYVALGVCITLLSMLGGRTIQHRAERESAGRADLLHRAMDVASLTSSASEEGFSFVLTGEPQEKERALAKLDAAETHALELRSQAQQGDIERARLTKVVSAVRELRGAATRMFDGYERAGRVDLESYDGYETALDALAGQVDELRTLTEAQNLREAEYVRRRSDRLTFLIGLLAVLVATGAGITFADRVTKPVLALRDVVTGFGAGQLDAVAPDGSADEIGDLARAFDAMMKNTRRHIQSIEYAQRRLKDIFVSIDEIFIVCDDAGTVLTANPACCRVSGLAEQEIIGAPVALLLRSEPQPGGSDAAWLSVGRDREAILKTADGRGIPVSLSVSRVHGQEGDGWVCVAQDMTQRRRLEAELRQSQKLEAIGRLAGGVAHDFNNMLSVVLGYTVMLLDGMSPDNPMYPGLIEVKKAGERSADLTQQLLAFSRQERLETRVVELNDAVAETLRMAGRVLGEDIEVVCSLADEACRTAVEPGQIEQIVMNLAVNARDAMPGGGKLTVETRLSVVSAADAMTLADLAPGRYATLVVTDSGTGMDAPTRERIFEPFFTTKEQGKGTGLGLSTVFGIVHRCHGHISVKSELGKGTTFTLYLPESSADASSPQPQRTSTHPRLAHQTILLVEDEESVRTLVSRILRRRGYQVLAAKDPTEATSICEMNAGPIDLLLTDVIMPQMNGHQLARQLLAARPKMKVLYMSGYTADVAFEGNVRDTLSFLQKPIMPDALTSKVRRALTSTVPSLTV
jgi:PAS domain S-box-containing protein